MLLLQAAAQLLRRKNMHFHQPPWLDLEFLHRRWLDSPCLSHLQFQVLHRPFCHLSRELARCWSNRPHPCHCHPHLKPYFVSLKTATRWPGIVISILQVTYTKNLLQIEDVADTPHTGVDAAHGLRIKCLKSWEHCVIVWCIVAGLAKDLERYFGVNNNNHAVLILSYLRVDPEFSEASIEFFCQVIAWVTLFETEISSVR